jgi:hypothetical protein
MVVNRGYGLLYRYYRCIHLEDRFNSANRRYLSTFIDIPVALRNHSARGEAIRTESTDIRGEKSRYRTANFKRKMNYDGAYKDYLIISLIGLDYTQQQQGSNRKPQPLPKTLMIPE